MTNPQSDDSEQPRSVGVSGRGPVTEQLLLADELSFLPGAELLKLGLEDLHAGEETEAAVLLEVAKPRLEALGVNVPSLRNGSPPAACAEHRLYHLLSSEQDAHSRYNALLARIASFARAAEHAAPR